jgi:hypothetical protein
MKMTMKATAPRCFGALCLTLLVFHQSAAMGAPARVGKGGKTDQADPIVQRYSHGNPTNHEQLMLEQMNQARANPNAEAKRLGIKLDEGLRPGSISAAAKQPLAFHDGLILSARGHSRWMIKTQTFSHTGDKNSSGGDRIEDAGYKFTGFYSWGENLGWMGSSVFVDLGVLTTQNHDGLFRSPVHRLNLCSDDFHEVGVGLVEGSFRGMAALVATQNFAKSGAYPDPWLLGVLYDDKDRDGRYDIGEGVPGITVTPTGVGWDTVSSASGGYAVPMPGNGALTVTFSGGHLAVPIERTVKRNGRNQKLDLILPPPPPPAPDIAVFQPSTSNLIAGLGKRSFGTGKKAGKVLSKSFKIKNNGPAVLKLVSVTSVGQQSSDFVVSPFNARSLAKGAEVFFMVTFKPTANGLRSATIRVKSNDPDEGSFDILVSGLGVGF